MRAITRAKLVVGLLAASIASSIGAGEPARPIGSGSLFETTEPLALSVHMNTKALCRDPRREKCADLPATLAYRDGSGAERRVEVQLRSRGRFRDETGDCSLPALFVFFGNDTAGTLFGGEMMLPLTTHCKTGTQYEQYVLKEYLAYRIYNTLTDKSLRVRLARVTYHDTSGRTEPLERYAFFVEHFDSLAAYHGAVVYKPEQFDVRHADADEMAVLDVFQYLIGNTDWSAAFHHNIVLIRDAAGLVTAVPYDFDFSGLVDAEYATPAPQLPIRSVTQRLFRGVCRPDTNWSRVFGEFEKQRDSIAELMRGLYGPTSLREEAQRYIEGFFELVSSPTRREREIIAECRSPRQD
jgi:hypothetical protein